MYSYVTRYLVPYFGSFKTRKRQIGGGGTGGVKKSLVEPSPSDLQMDIYIYRSYAGLKYMNRSKGSQREAEYISVCSSDRHVGPSDKVLNSV